MSITISPFTRSHIKLFYDETKPREMGAGTFESYIYLISEKIISRVWANGVIDYVSFTYDKGNTYAGSFAFYKDHNRKFIELNFANIKTYRDLAFSFFHEWKHALQYLQIGYEGFVSEAENLSRLLDKGRRKDYVHHYLEQDADDFAFYQESEMDYKSFVLNPHAENSVFVLRKSVRA